MGPDEIRALAGLDPQPTTGKPEGLTPEQLEFQAHLQETARRTNIQQYEQSLNPQQVSKDVGGATGGTTGPLPQQGGLGGTTTPSPVQVLDLGLAPQVQDLVKKRLNKRLLQRCLARNFHVKWHQMADFDSVSREVLLRMQDPDYIRNRCRSLVAQVPLTTWSPNLALNSILAITIGQVIGAQ